MNLQKEKKKELKLKQLSLKKEYETHKENIKIIAIRRLIFDTERSLKVIKSHLISKNHTSFLDILNTIIDKTKFNSSLEIDFGKGDYLNRKDLFNEINLLLFIGEGKSKEFTINKLISEFPILGKYFKEFLNLKYLTLNDKVLFEGNTIRFLEEEKKK